MATGISKTQLVLLRGSLRTLVLFGPLYVLVRVLNMRDNGDFTWDTWLGGAPYEGGCLSPKVRTPWTPAASRSCWTIRAPRCGSRPSPPR